MKNILFIALLAVQINWAQTAFPVGTLQLTNDGVYNSTINSGNVARMDLGFDGSTGYVKFGAHTGNGQRDNILYMRGSDGNVGIGTISPKAKLHSYANFQSDIVNKNNASAYLQGQDVGVIFGQYDLSGGYGSWVQSIRGTDDTPFSMSLNPIGGNVGIGTTNPDVRLTVNGNAKIKDNLFISGASGQGKRF